MYSSQSKLKRQEPVFKTPMTYSPRIAGQTGKPLPSPSRAELWKKQLGFEDSDMSPASGSDSDEENTPYAGNANISIVEYRALQRELEERCAQRDDLLFKIKSLNDKNKQYKTRLEKEENTKRQQMKILCKTQETQLQEKDNLISNLQALVEELEEQGRGTSKVKPLGDNNGTHPTSKSATKLVEEVKRLQGEKISLTHKLEQVQTESTSIESDKTAVSLQQVIASLKEENTDLREAMDRLSKHQIMQPTDTGPCHTDTEKQVEKLQQDNCRLQDELLELQQVSSRNADMFKQGTQQYQKLDEEMKKTKQKILNLENELSSKTKEIYSLQSTHRQEQTTLINENQQTSRRLRELQAEVISLQAKEPEVITKIKKVEVTVESNELKKSYAQSQSDISSLESQNKLLQSEVTKVTGQLHISQAETEELQRSLSQCQSNKLNMDCEMKVLQSDLIRVTDQMERARDESNSLKESFTQCKSENSRFESEVKLLQSQVSKVTGQLHKAQEDCQEKDVKIQTLEQETETVMEQLTSEIESLKQQKAEAVLAVRQEMEESMQDLRTKYQKMCHTLCELRPLLSHLSQSYVALDKQAKRFPRLIQEVVAEVKRETSKAISGIHEHNKELVRKYHREMHLRKKYHNIIVELKGNIRVFCRVRPKIKEDGNGPMSEPVVSFDRDDDGLIFVNNKGRTQMFELDRVFTETSTQTEVFGEVQSLVTSCIDGYNVCIFAYGQTGSGKTYTMEGTTDNAGINQRALRELFREISDRGCDWTYCINVSVLEIYNEMIRDLLSDDPSYKLELKMNTDGTLFVQGLNQVEVKSVADINRVFSVGQKNRMTATTNMNEHSSRSHALLCVTVTGINNTTNAKTTGKLNLVDLAGSERVSKSGADGARLKEAQNINKSLSSLGDVIHALRSRQSHVPYRNSKLTYLLQDSLGGDSKTLMIVQVAPVERNLGESVCSLNFAQRVRTVELGQASRKVENGDMEGDMIGSPNVKGTPSKGGGTPSRNTPSKAGTPSIAQRNTPQGSGPRTPLRMPRLNSKLNF